MSSSGERQKLGQFSQKVEQSLGIIPGTKLWSPFPFAGLNLQDTPPAIDDKEFSYLENYFRLGNGYLRTAWDVAPPIYTASSRKTILPYFFWYNIGNTDYVAVFFTDGTAVQVDSTGAVTTITAVASTFYKPNGNLPICSQSGTQYLLIANNNTQNDYWIWDGTNLYGAGTLSPFVDLLSSGQNYNTPPAITAVGGTGSGATFSSIVQGGSVTNIQVVNPGTGYSVGDTVQLVFSGGGSDNGAILEAFLTSGLVAAITISAAGSGYTSAPTIAFTGGAGTGAAATAFISGPVVSISVAAGGSGYTTPPTVTLTGGGGAGATATANLTTGAVSSFTVTNGGSGYTSAPTVNITSGGGTGASGTALITKGVTAITITNPGSGYTSAPAVGFSSGSGSGAAATALLSASGVSSVSVINAGTGFTSVPSLTFVGGGGSGASAVALLSATALAFVNIASGGVGYYNTPTVTIAPPLSGVTATAVATVNNGSLVAVTLTNAGSGYVGVPLVVITANALDTGASGATAVAQLVPTTIASVTVMSTGTGYVSAPAVLVAAGSNHSAYAIAELMPFGVNGSALETFNSRVWLADQFQMGITPTAGNFIVSAAESLTDFATSDGGVSFVNSDRFLRKRYVGIRQSNGYLYFFGDSSISVVSNIQTTGVPATTTFSYLNVDPQIGMAWRDTVQDFGRTIVFANETGVYGLYGGAATKISSKLDRLFDAAIYPPDARAITPTASVATVFDVKHYFLEFTVVDPETFVVRNVMVGWNEKEWSVFSQTPAVEFIGTQEVNSMLTSWGTDGVSIYQLFGAPSATLTKRLTTKYYGTEQLIVLKDFLALWLQAQDISGLGIAMTVNMIASGVGVQPTTNPHFNADSVADTQFNSATYMQTLFQEPVFNAPIPYFSLWGSGTGGFSFDTLGVQFSTQSEDFTIANLVIAYQDATAYM